MAHKLVCGLGEAIITCEITCFSFSRNGLTREVDVEVDGFFDVSVIICQWRNVCIYGISFCLGFCFVVRPILER